VIFSTVVSRTNWFDALPDRVRHLKHSNAVRERAGSAGNYSDPTKGHLNPLQQSITASRQQIFMDDVEGLVEP